MRGQKNAASSQLAEGIDVELQPARNARARSETGALSLLALRGGSGRSIRDRDNLDETEMMRAYSPSHQQKLVVDHLLARMLPVKVHDENPDTSDLPWKIVKFDSHWRDVLSMCMPSSEMMMHGVLGYGHIEDDRQADQVVPIAPAAYFMRANNHEAMAAAAEDIENGRFGSFYLHASGPEHPDRWEKGTPLRAGAGLACLCCCHPRP